MKEALASAPAAWMADSTKSQLDRLLGLLTPAVPNSLDPVEAFDCRELENELGLLDGQSCRLTFQDRRFASPPCERRG